MKVLIKAPLSEYTGYGNDGLGIAQAFMRRGDDVYLQPSSLDAPIPPEVAELLTKKLEAPFDLFINHVDPSALSCTEVNERTSGLTVAWTMWEYMNFHNGPKKAQKTLRKRIKRFDAFVGYSDIDVTTFREYYDGPILLRQGGFNPENWPVIEDRDWDSREFYFFMIGVLSERKDPFVAIDAFHKAQQLDPEFNRWARLSLKTTDTGLHSKIEDANRQTDPETGETFTTIRIFYDIWPTDVVRSFYEAQHVLLSPSRGEGKNMPALEFMSTGGTVIATNWAGHTMWLDDAYSYALDYSLAPESPEHPNTYNARADVDHLAQLMLHTFHNREEVREKGRKAAETIPKTHSWDYVVEDLLVQLRDNVPVKGQELWEKSRKPRPQIEVERVIEIRCPDGARRLLGKALPRGEHRILPGNLIEFSCDECKRRLNRLNQDVSRVLHRYNVVGELVETVSVKKPTSEADIT